MAFQQSQQYERAPSGSEELYYPTYTDQAHLHPQLRDYDRSVSPISLQFQTHLDGSDYTLIHEQAKSSQPTHNFTDISSPISKTRYKRSCFDVLSDYWWWEIGSMLVSLLCFIAIAVTLYKVQGHTLSSWHSFLAPNTIISILATISKTSLMLAVAACLSQLKWFYFKRAPRPLYDIQLFDDASRGPRGAFDLLIFLKRGSDAGWAYWASILTILALALDPFAQQILSFPLRTVPLPAGSAASIATAQIYDTGNPSGSTNSGGKNVDMAMQGAIMNGLYTLNSPVEFTCTTGNCTWPAFYTIGICSACKNVTGRVNATCSRGRGQSCDYMLPSGLKLTSSWWSSSGGGHITTLNATARAGFANAVNISDWLVDAGLIRIAEDASDYSVPEAFECRISWCAKRYSSVKVASGQISTPDIQSWPLKSPSEFYDRDGKWLNPFTVLDSAKTFDGPSNTFTVNANDHRTLSNWLAGTFFQTSNQDAVARALYLQSDISQTFAKIATSMTNKMRQGQNSTVVFGTAVREETFIHVSWVWLILPGVVVLMGVVLLAASMMLSRGDRGLWKSSVLATMFTNMRGWEHEGLDPERPSELESHTKDMKGSLKRNEKGGLEFVRV